MKQHSEMCKRVITVRNTDIRSGNHKRRNIKLSFKRTKPAGKELHTVLNGTLGDKNEQQQKRLICNTIIKSIITCNCEMWPRKRQRNER